MEHHCELARQRYGGALEAETLLERQATPEPIKDWSLTTLKEKLIKIGAKVVQAWPLRRLPDGRGRCATTARGGDLQM
jgi:hypothetical protein